MVVSILEISFKRIKRLEIVQYGYSCCYTEVAGIFKKGFEDTIASYGFKIIDEHGNPLFDLTITDGLI